MACSRYLVQAGRPERGWRV